MTPGAACAARRAHVWTLVPVLLALWDTTSLRGDSSSACRVQRDVTPTLRGAPCAHPACLATMPTSRGPQPAARARKVILAHSKMQLLVCLACLDRSATPPAARCVWPVLLGVRLHGRLLRSVHCAGQVRSKVWVMTPASPASQGNTNCSRARRAVTCVQRTTTALAQM